MRHINVILRTCDRVQAFSGNRLRDFGSKIEVMKKCTTSLRNSINNFINSGGSCNFIVVDDHSSVEMVDYLKSLNPDLFICLDGTGNGESFGKCVDLAKECRGLVLLIEDDYLLKLEAIQSMVDSHLKIKNELGIEPCIYPSDYPDRYKKLEPSYITLGIDRHYRSITSTTCTFMYDASIFKEFEKQLKVFCDYGKKPGITEANSVNLVYNKYICFSPIPSLAEHYQYFDTLSPFYKE